MSEEDVVVVTLPGTLKPEDYWMPNSERTLSVTAYPGTVATSEGAFSVNYPPPARAWFIVYDEVQNAERPEDRYRSVGLNAAVIGRHPVIWAVKNPNPIGITYLRFFAEIPLDVALQWPNYADYRGSENE